eukprot:CAMPEP_0172707978 /NCGR_PEP_ID=MMETSP1074-20121228/50289_1 /TAXON_ID=2916 /ORGANISM="Ceratium fusus, Strain PA161109" /LENGTH=36 /DNA_ID= /DNA_START= /DNA_END= /DNA_ORIENTATION=
MLGRGGHRADNLRWVCSGGQRLWKWLRSGASNMLAV